ncbi:MAG: hypothetical protein KFF49_00115 [Bacteroidales bacterium]|nr:hypothetical protein [Bacteroidales bacterium]
MKVIKKIWWFPLVIYIIIIPSYMSARVYNEPCKEIKITIRDSIQYSFVSPGKLLSLIQDEDTQVYGAKIGSINLKGMEETLSGLPELEYVEVYATADGVLHVEVDQRNPRMRVITSWGNNYYIDKNGFVIPHSNSYTPRVLVVTGNIEVPDICVHGRSILEEDDNSKVKQTLDLVEYITDDPFWNSMIEQIHINERGEYELVPRIGSHIVKFGGILNYEWKLNILASFYRQAMAKAGWNSYKEIDMRFKGQVVCRR